MWNRACPLCFTKVPQGLVLTRGDELSCPSCHTPLELSRASRVSGALIGLIAGFIGARVALGLSGDGKWVMPVVGAVLGYGIASALLLYFLSDLVVQPKPTVSHFPQTHR
jgi:hypothetical protein